jgi:type IV pilus assembly protein PilE
LHAGGVVVPDGEGIGAIGGYDSLRRTVLIGGTVVALSPAAAASLERQLAAQAILRTEEFGARFMISRDSSGSPRVDSIYVLPKARRWGFGVMNVDRAKRVRIGQRGLTLIELMVVIAVLAILATIAVPAYDRYQRTARRADGKAALTAVALAQERAFSVYQKYVTLSSLDDLAGLDKGIADGLSPKQRYSISLVPDPPNPSNIFVAQAVPRSEDLECQTLQINAAGQKTVTGSPAPTKTAAECW